MDPAERDDPTPRTPGPIRQVYPSLMIDEPEIFLAFDNCPVRLVMMNERIGLFGGSFDPIHHGHLIMARAMAERLRLARVILLPSAQPPHKQADSLAPATHRTEMVRLAIEHDPLFQLSDHDLSRTGPTFTVDTVQHFRDHYGPTTPLFWIIGADSLAELTTWRDVPGILARCEIATATRPGSDPLDWDALGAAIGRSLVERVRSHVHETPAIGISSTDIRRRVAGGLSIRYFVPGAVNRYITQNDLYRDPGATA